MKDYTVNATPRADMDWLESFIGPSPSEAVRAIMRKFPATWSIWPSQVADFKAHGFNVAPMK